MRLQLAKRQLRSALVVLLLPAPMLADGGEMRVRQAVGPFEISVFTAPAPLRAGAVDVSVLVLEGADHLPVLDAEVDVTLRAAGVERSARATHAAATNQLLYAAALDLPAAGRWALEARVRDGARTASASCEIDVAPPLPPALAFWPYLALPVVAIALFALHQWLTRSAQKIAAR